MPSRAPKNDVKQLSNAIKSAKYDGKRPSNRPPTSYLPSGSRPFGGRAPTSRRPPTKEEHEQRSSRIVAILSNNTDSAEVKVRKALQLHYGLNQKASMSSDTKGPYDYACHESDHSNDHDDTPPRYDSDSDVDREALQVLTQVQQDFDDPDEQRHYITEYLKHKRAESQHQSLVLMWCLSSNITSNTNKGIKTFIDTGASFDMHHGNLRQPVPGHSYKLDVPIIINQGTGSLRLDKIELIERFIADPKNPNTTFVLLTPSLRAPFDQEIDIISARTACVFGLGLHMPPADRFNPNNQDMLYNGNESVKLRLHSQPNGIPYLTDIGVKNSRNSPSSRLIDAYTGRPYDQNLAIKRAKNRLLNDFLAKHGSGGAEANQEQLHLERQVDRLMLKMKESTGSASSSEQCF